jgi:hypothetical protein
MRKSFHGEIDRQLADFVLVAKGQRENNRATTEQQQKKNTKKF